MNNYRRQSRHVHGAACAITLGLLSLNAAHAQINTLVNFNGSDGTTPLGGVTLSNGVLYGTTSADFSGGTIFSVPVTGGTPTTLAISTQRFDSYGNLTLSGGILYGTDEVGGDYGGGSIFAVPLAGTGTDTSDIPAPTTLVSFGGPNAQEPVGEELDGDLLLSGSTLYGTTFSGSTSNSISGTVYSFNLNTGAATTLASFSGGGGGSMAGLILSGNTLYGSTQGDGTNGSSSVFSLNLSTGTVTNLANLGFYGGGPFGNLTLVGNTLYGTTFGNNNGDVGQGMLFSLDLATGTVTIPVAFTGANGANPASNLTLNGDTLYGSTRAGGAYNDGTVFSFNLDTGTLTTLVSFDGADGAYPQGDLTLSGNTLYGTTAAGGADGDGTVFSLQLPADASPEAAPEPSSYSMLLFGALGLAAMRCFRNAGRIKVSLGSPRSQVLPGNARVRPAALTQPSRSQLQPGSPGSKEILKNKDWPRLTAPAAQFIAAVAKARGK